MKHLELEKELTRRMMHRRIFQACLILFFVVVAIIFNVIYENSEVEKNFHGKKIVTQNADWYYGVAIGIMGAIFTAISLIIDFCCSKFKTVQVGADYLTVYRGYFTTQLYVNGDSTYNYGHYIEARLSDRSKVTVSIGKWSVHMSFSGGHPPIDLYI